MCEVRGGREVVCNLGVVYADDEAALGAWLGVRFLLASRPTLHPSFSCEAAPQLLFCVDALQLGSLL